MSTFDSSPNFTVTLLVMSRSVKSSQHLVMGGAAVQVPAIELVATAGVGVEVDGRSRLFKVELGVLGIEGGSLNFSRALFHVQEPMHKEQGMVLLCFRHARSASTLPITTRIRAVTCLVASAITIEAVVIAVMKGPNG